MALNYPLALADWFDLLPISEAAFSLSQATASSRTAGGEVIVDRIGVSLWSVQLKMGRLTPQETSSVQALIEAAIGPGRSVMTTPPQNAAPITDPSGTSIATAAPQISAIDRAASTIDISGMPSTYQLLRGDYFSINFGPGSEQTTLHRIAENKPAVFGAVSNIQIEPNLPVGVNIGAAIRFVRPILKGVVVPGSYDPGRPARWITEGIALELIQTLRAD